MLDWRLSRLSHMSGPEVYEMLALRQRVFMIEQAIPVLDADGRDAEAVHLLGRGPRGLVAYARIFVPQKPDEPLRIGRVVVAKQARGSGVGRALMEQALACAESLAPGLPVQIAAQAYLKDFYESFGFAAASEIYDDHGVPHLDMVRQE